MSLLRRIVAGVKSGLARPSTPPAVSLKVTDENGKVLVDVADAQKSDYWLSVPLLSEPVVLDLYGHYQQFIANGGKRAYRGTAVACNTYVKFGECMQDRCELDIVIQPSAKRRGA